MFLFLQHVYHSVILIPVYIQSIPVFHQVSGWLRMHL